MKEGLTPEHFQYCVAHHMEDTQYPQTPAERLDAFRKEAQELSQAMFLDIYGEQNPEHVKEEVGDVLFNLVGIMNMYGLSFEDVAAATLQKVMTRYNGDIREKLEQEGFNGHDACYQEAKRRAKI